MSIVYFTLVAAVLYLFADWMLRRVEMAIGHTLQYRTAVFFCILLPLALASFTLIGHLTGVNPGE